MEDLARHHHLAISGATVAATTHPPSSTAASLETSLHYAPAMAVGRAME